MVGLNGIAFLVGCIRVVDLPKFTQGTGTEPLGRKMFGRMFENILKQGYRASEVTVAEQTLGLKEFVRSHNAGLEKIRPALFNGQAECIAHLQPLLLPPFLPPLRGGHGEGSVFAFALRSRWTMVGAT